MSESAQRRPAVLLVEDDSDLAAAICLNLEGEFEVERATDAAEALMLLGTKKYDAILSDHMMPGKLQGLDFLVTASERAPETKRILMTGYMNPELLTRGVMLAKLSGVLLKPATMGQIRKALHDSLGLSV